MSVAEASATAVAGGGSGDSTAPCLPEAFKRLQAVEQKIVDSVELCGSTMEELSKMGGANKEKTTELCKAFLENMRDIKAALHEAIISNSQANGTSNQCSDYVAKFTAMTAASKVEVSLMHLERVEAALQAGLRGAAKPLPQPTLGEQAILQATQGVLGMADGGAPTVDRTNSLAPLLLGQQSIALPDAMQLD
mmetsp:Transcript_21585/g.59985  ORF Transcript_21585/g.59985 Transcript_21585/m.59985 type:complete len:193 (-) Transcript_21585:15-593(-)